MATLQSDTAVGYGNTVMLLVQQLRAIRAQAAEIVTLNATTPLGNLWNALSTTPLLVDGTLGVADTAQVPVLTHPIDTRVYTALNRAVKASDLSNALQELVDFVAFCAGTAIALNGARPSNTNAVSM
jgi:hypothetical protein